MKIQPDDIHRGAVLQSGAVPPGKRCKAWSTRSYPNLQVIIQDGGSTRRLDPRSPEDFVQQVSRYLFQLFAEKDAGQADALNRGFARTKGEILGFLNSDDTLYPGCLSRVAREIDPARNRYIVFGRCLFTGEGTRYVGVEHPAEYKSHYNLLAIWTRGYNTLPQPSIFWHRRVWEQCGTFDLSEHHVLDYDLFCRFSRRFHFHKVDELWSTFRMHDISKSSQRTEAEVLAMSIQASRRYWGAWYSPLRWRCELSHWLPPTFHRPRPPPRAPGRAGVRAAQAAVGHVGAAYDHIVLAEDGPRQVALRPVSQRVPWLLRKVVTRDTSFSTASTTTAGSARASSPSWRFPATRTGSTTAWSTSRRFEHDRFEVQLVVEGAVVDRRLLDDPGQFKLAADVSGLQGKRINVEIKSSSFFMPREIMGLDDNRELSIKLYEVTFENNEAEMSQDRVGWVSDSTFASGPPGIPLARLTRCRRGRGAP